MCKVVASNASIISVEKRRNPLSARPGETVIYIIRLFNTAHRSQSTLC